MFDVRNNELTVYIHTFTAVDNQILTERLHVHSEYDTKWENKLREWSEAKYYKWHNYETMRGDETCITILKFMQVDSVNDFIIDINTYLYKGDTLRKETGVLMIDCKNLEIDDEPEYDSAGYTEEDR
jgi:hypothetical protein